MDIHPDVILPQGPGRELGTDVAMLVVQLMKHMDPQMQEIDMKDSTVPEAIIVRYVL